MRYIIVLILLIMSGCATLPTVTSRTNERKVSVIYVGMLFDEADTKLKTYGAEETMFQVVLSKEAHRKGRRLHYYVLSSGEILDLVSMPGKEGRLVASLSLSPYELKSRSKIDHARDQYFQSFVECEELDLENRPNQRPERNAGAASSSTSTPSSGMAHP